ncbi:MAG: hypothetical protein ACRDA4_00330 [Filifactoraceae bacterium]
MTDDETYNFTSGLARGLVGSALFGSIGLISGALSAKDSNNLILIEFVDGQKSILQVDGAIAKVIIQKCTSLKPTESLSILTCERCNKSNSPSSKISFDSQIIDKPIYNFISINIINLFFIKSNFR